MCRFDVRAIEERETARLTGMRLHKEEEEGPAVFLSLLCYARETLAHAMKERERERET